MYEGLKHRLERELFGPEAIRDLHRNVVCMKGRDEGHLHDERCDDPFSSVDFILQKLPASEIEVAQTIARIFGTQIVFDGKWLIRDSTDEYLPIDGDWFVRRLVIAYSRFYSSVIHGPLAEFIDSESRSETTTNKEQRETLRAITEAKATRHFRVCKQLTEERGVKAVTRLLEDLTNRPQQEINAEYTSLADFFSETVERGLVEGLIPFRGIGQMYGPAYSGKTFTAVDLALSVATGRSQWLGHPINVNGPQSVLYIGAEGGDALRKLMQGWLLGNHVNPAGVPVKVRDSAAGQTFSLTGEGYGLAELKEDWGPKYGSPRLIIIDPQADVTGGVDENSKELSDVLRPLAQWANEAGVFVLLVHHTGKDESKGARGSSSQRAMMDVEVELSKGNSSDTRELSFKKIKGEVLPDDSFTMRFNRQDFTGYGYRSWIECQGIKPSAEDEKAARQALKGMTVLGAIRDGCVTGAQISTKTSIPRDQLRQILNDLEAKGKIRNEGVGNNSHWITVDGAA